MNATELMNAANRLAAAAAERSRWAEKDEPRWFSLHSSVAQQLNDRAAQVRSWAATARYREERGETCPAEIEAWIDAAVREFLGMIVEA
jgi:hypothetical protein